jgi:hypothetical protein
VFVVFRLLLNLQVVTVASLQGHSNRAAVYKKTWFQDHLISMRSLFMYHISLKLTLSVSRLTGSTGERNASIHFMRVHMLIKSDKRNFVKHRLL